MQILSYGYKKPEDGDLSTEWFPALADNWVKSSTHDHDGVNSEPINPAGIDKSNFTQTFLAAESGGWIADTYTGNYYKDITVPSGITQIDDFFVKFMENSSRDLLIIGYEKLTDQSYRVKTNDNALDLLIKYV